MSKKSGERFNILSHDVFEYLVIKILNNLYHNDRNIEGVNQYEVYLLNNIDIQPITSELVRFVQENQGEDKLMELVIKRLTEIVSKNKKEVFQNIKRCEEKLGTLRNDVRQDIVGRLPLVPGYLMLEGVLQYALLFNPKGWLLLFLKYFWQGALGTTFFVECAGPVLGGLLGLDSTSNEIRQVMKDMRDAKYVSNELGSSITVFKHLSSLNVHIERLTSLAHIDYDMLLECEAYHALRTNIADPLVLFSLCKYHIDLYNYCYSRFELNNDFCWVEAGRSELIKCIDLLMPQSKSVLKNDALSTETKILLLLDVLKVLGQYNASFAANIHGDDQRFRLQKRVARIIEFAKKALKDFATPDRCRTFDQLSDMDQMYFSQLLEMFEATEVERAKYLAAINGDKNLVVIQQHSTDTTTEINGGFCNIL